MKTNPFAKLIFITQFGITTIGSILISVLVSVWIRQTFNTGYWVIVVGIILGALSMFYSFYKIYLRYKKEEENNHYPPGSNDHI